MITIIEKMEVVIVVTSGHCAIAVLVALVSGTLLGCFLAGSGGGD